VNVPSSFPTPDVTTDVLSELSGPERRRAMRIVTIAWVFGAAWMHAVAGAPLTVFAQALGCSNFEFGILAAMPFVAALLSLPASVWIDRSGRRNVIFAIGLYANRVLWFPLALLPIVVLTYGEATYAGVAIALFLILTFLMHAGQASGGPAWVSWMADIVPEAIRGRYFARRRQWGIPSAIGAALLAGWAVDRYATGSQSAILWTCAIVFMAASVLGIVDIALFHKVPHAVRPKPREPLLRTLVGPLRNAQFVSFSIGTAILMFAIAGQGQFVNKYLVEHLHLKSVQVQLMVLVGPLLAQLLVLPIWGLAIDRYGKKPAMLIAILGLVPVGFGWVLISAEHVWLGYVLAILGSAMWTGVEVANFNMVMELSGTDQRGYQGGSAYMAVNAVIINVAGCAGGIFFGSVAELLSDLNYKTGWWWLAEISYYHVLFILSAVLRLIAVVPMLRVREPEAAPTLDTLRFMTGSLYNNVVGVVMLPVRLFRGRPE